MEQRSATPAKPRLRPRDAATLIVYRRDPDGLRLLMGRRSMAHVFMPGALVFPGGRAERMDRFAPSVDALHPVVERKLGLHSRVDAAKARALALAAIRETFEETGYLIGSVATVRGPKAASSWSAFLANGVVPALGHLRLVSRAITPPTQPRRFDTRFFAVAADAVAKQVAVPDEELESPSWVTFDEARAHGNVARITRLVLDELEPRLLAGDLPADGPTMFRKMRRGAFKVETI